MSNIKFKHNLFVPWTFKLVRYFTSINVKKADVKFLGCIDNQMFLPMELRHVDPLPATRFLPSFPWKFLLTSYSKDYVWHDPKGMGVACTV